MTNNNNCFGYIRVSTVKQGEGVSLEAQKEAIEAFANRNDLCIIQWFEEKETAAKRGRPIFTSMIKQLHQGKANNLIVHKIDRSARNLTDWAEIGELSDAGVNVHFATESLDFRSRGGRLTADIQAVIASDYIRNLREETIKGLRGRLKQGFYPFAAPVGYENNGGGKLKTIDPIKGPIVKRLFELYALGEYSVRGLTAEANKLGLENKKGQPITKRLIEGMLRNKFYVGLMELKSLGTVFKGNHEPLISTKLFETVETVLSDKTKKSDTRHNLLFRGIFRCKNCARMMVPEKQYLYVYYRCQNIHCPTKTIREDRISDQVENTLSELDFSEQAISTIHNRITLGVKQLTKRETNSTIPMQINFCKTQKSKLVDALINNVIDKSNAHEKLQEIDQNIKKLEERMRSNANYTENAHTLSASLEILKSLCFTYKTANDAEKRQLLKIIGSKRELDSKNLYFKTRNWVSCLQKTATVPNGGPQRRKCRRDNDLTEPSILELLDITNCLYFQELLRLHQKIVSSN